MADVWKEASFGGGKIKYKTVTDTSLVHQPAEPRTNKRLREENMMLASLTPEQQAERLAACLIGDAPLAPNDFIQAYVGMYDDLITPPADSKVKCGKTLFLDSRIDSPHKTAIQAQPWLCLSSYQTNIGQFTHIPVRLSCWRQDSEMCAESFPPCSDNAMAFRSQCMMSGLKLSSA